MTSEGHLASVSVGEMAGVNRRAVISPRSGSMWIALRAITRPAVELSRRVAPYESRSWPPISRTGRRGRVLYFSSVTRWSCSDIGSSSSSSRSSSSSSSGARGIIASIVRGPLLCSGVALLPREEIAQLPRRNDRRTRLAPLFDWERARTRRMQRLWRRFMNAPAFSERYVTEREISLLTSINTPRYYRRGSLFWSCCSRLLYDRATLEKISDRLP